MTALFQMNWLPSYKSHSPDKFACSKPRPTVLTMPGLDRVKRKWSDSADAHHQASGDSPSKRSKLDGSDEQAATAGNQELPASSVDVTSNLQVKCQGHSVATEQLPLSTNLEATSDARANAASSTSQLDPPGKQQNESILTNKMDPAKRERLRQKIGAMFDQEILLKHNEQRLIEQELAKCQVALEQLRRCREIPWPGHAKSPLTSDHVRTGTGPALEIRPGMAQPQSPAPWGVADGPYTRHYARWLLPDARFDSMPFENTRRTAAGNTSMQSDGRRLRGSNADFSVPNSARTPMVPTFPRERMGPPTVKRASDGLMVKLICNMCNKEDTSSVQGFLNHCRIAHQKNFESHQAAAEECGVPLETGEVAATPTVECAPPLASPMIARAPVHPLIYGGHKRNDSNILGQAGHSRSIRRPEIGLSQPTPQAPASVSATRKIRTPSFKPNLSLSLPSKSSMPGFVASTQTPSLSAFLKKQGVTGDLSEFVNSSKEQIDIDQVESLVKDDEVEDDRPKTSSTRAPPASDLSSQQQAPPTTQSNGSRVSAQAPQGASAGPSALSFHCQVSSSSASSASVSQAHQSRLPAERGPRPIMPNSQFSSFTVDPVVPSTSSPAPDPISPEASAINTPTPLNHPTNLSPVTAVSTNPGMVSDRGEDDEDEAPHSDHEKVADEPNAGLSRRRVQIKRASEAEDGLADVMDLDGAKEVEGFPDFAASSPRQQGLGDAAGAEGHAEHGTGAAKVAGAEENKKDTGKRRKRSSTGTGRPKKKGKSDGAARK